MNEWMNEWMNHMDEWMVSKVNGHKFWYLGSNRCIDIIIMACWKEPGGREDERNEWKSGWVCGLTDWLRLAGWLDDWESDWGGGVSSWSQWLTWTEWLTDHDCLAVWLSGCLAGWLSPPPGLSTLSFMVDTVVQWLAPGLEVQGQIWRQSLFLMFPRWG